VKKLARQPRDTRGSVFGRNCSFQGLGTVEVGNYHLRPERDIRWLIVHVMSNVRVLEIETWCRSLRRFSTGEPHHKHECILIIVRRARGTPEARQRVEHWTARARPEARRTGDGAIRYRTITVGATPPSHLVIWCEPTTRRGNLGEIGAVSHGHGLGLAALP
jgi:hypothetical protein